MRPEPLIVTLTMDRGAQQFFDRLRQEHFPPERNYLTAHVTLFHALPGAHLLDIEADLVEVCSRAAFEVDVTGVRFLGRGVAYTLRATELDAIRDRLAAGWQQWLTPQDQQRWTPHITVQNKVTPDAARALHTALTATLEPSKVEARGLALWRYVGGPWKPVRELLFRS